MTTMIIKQPIHKRGSVDREEYLLGALDSSKGILHLGCSDAPFTETRIQHGELLHSRLLGRAPQIVGHDISAEHLKFLVATHPKAKFIQGDVEALSRTFDAGSFDLIIAGEIVEHLFNPGIFFDGCKHTLKPDGRLILTIPNAFGFRRWIHTICGVENYHPEHTFYFSENTIAFLAKRHGFKLVKSLYYPTSAQDSKIKSMLYFFVERLPAMIFGNHLLEGLILEFEPQA